MTPFGRVVAFVRAHWRDAMPYILVGTADATIATIVLRRPGYIALGDVYPGYFMPGNHVLQHNLALWGYEFSGLGSPQYGPTNVLFSLWGDAGLHLGLSGPTIQWLFYLSLLLMQGLGATWFARVLFPERRLVAAIAGLAYPFSFYNALSVLNPIQAFATGYIPAIAAFFMSRLRAPVHPVRFAIEIGFLSLGFMLLVSIPPMAVFVLLWALLWIAVAQLRWHNLSTTWRGLALGAVLGGALNAWWVYAAWLTLFGSGGSAEQTFAGPFEWAFVHRNASILNLLSMQGFWAYPLPEYFPWARPYTHGLLKFALYVPALFAILGLVLAPFRRRTGLLLGIMLVCLFMAKGMHAPLGSVNAFLYAKLPFYWLWRDPQNEVDIVLYLCMFTLAGLGVSQLVSLGIRRWRHMVSNARQLRNAGGAAGAALAALVLANGIAFIRGDFIAESWLFGAAKFVVTPPSYWSDAAQYLNSRPDEARVLLLPNDDYYQMGYAWGFYGNDIVAASAFERPVMILAPQATGYLAGSSALRTEFLYLQRAVHTQTSVPIAPLLASLGVGWIVQRNDVLWSLPGRAIMAPHDVARYLTRQPGIKKVATFGKLDIYKIIASPRYVSAFDGLGLWLSRSIPDLSVALSLTDKEVPWILRATDGTHVSGADVHGFIQYGDPAVSSTTVVTRRGQAESIPRTITVRLSKQAPSQLVLNLAGPTLLNAGRSWSWRRDVVLALRLPLKNRVVVEIGAQHFVVDARRLSEKPLDIGTYTAGGEEARVHARAWVDLGRDLFAGRGWSAVEDCNRSAQTGAATTQLRASLIGRNGVQLSAPSDAACVRIESPRALAPGVAVLTEIDYKTVQGNAPQVAIAFGRSQDSHVILPSIHDWSLWRAWNPSHPAGVEQLYAYAFGTERGAIDAYRAPAAWVMVLAAEVPVALDSERMATAVGAIGTLPALPAPNLVRDARFAHGLWSPIFDAYRSGNFTAGEAGLKAAIPQTGVLELSARADGVGECQRIAGVGGRLLRITYEARTVYGHSPVLRVLDEASNSLYEGQWTRSNRRWERRADDAAVLPTSDTVLLCLYAFAVQGPTKVQFRNISLTAWPGGIGDVLWVGGVPPAAIPVQSGTRGSARYEMTIPRGPRVMVLRTSFTPAWILESDGAPLDWPHVAIDGYLNGWLVPDGEAHHVAALYEPALAYGKLQTLSVVTMMCMLLGLIAWLTFAALAAWRVSRG